MNEATSVFNVARQLKGMSVVAPQDGHKLGTVADAFILPAAGQLSGLVFVDDLGQSHALSAADFGLHLPSGVVVAFEEDQLPTDDKSFDDGVLICQQLLNAEVLTRGGQFLGRIADVFISQEKRLAIYRITYSHWQNWRGGGLYLTTEWPLAWSETGLRLIIPTEAANQSVFHSLDEAIRSTET